MQRRRAQQNSRSSSKQSKLGKNQKKILLLLCAGVALASTPRLSKQFKILGGVVDEWREIDRQALERGIRSLHKSKFIKKVSHTDGAITIALTQNGQRRVMRYNLESMRIKRPRKWDACWRVVIYDIPESHRDLRIELLMKLKMLGFVEIQQSVFIHPYECRKEIRKLVEAFEAGEYVRWFVVKEIDDDVALRRHFGLSKHGH